MADAATAAISMAAPTLPLKISLTQLPNPAPEGSPHPALARSHHTLTVLSNKAFLFGGLHDTGKLCPPGIHTLTLPSSKSTSDSSTSAENNEHTAAYTCYPPYTLQDPSTGELLVPSPRTDHAACGFGNGRYLLIHGGRDEAGRPVGNNEEGEGNCLWRWDCEALSWSKLRGDTQLGVTMRPRWGHWMFAEEKQGEGFVVVVGGKGGAKEQEREVWMYDFHGMVWTSLPSVPAKPLAAAYAGGRVHVISTGGEGELGGVVHYLDLKGSTEERAKPGALVWKTVSFPANPLAPGPRPRAGGALVPLTTGHGREYLVYMLGCAGDGGDEKEYYSDIWTLQLPAHGHSAAAVKDKIKEKLLPGKHSGEFRWAEAQIVPTEQVTEEGKVHPGPRGWFGADACLDGQGLVLWGGVNARGETEGDGWLLRLAYGYADSDRWE